MNGSTDFWIKWGYFTSVQSRTKSKISPSLSLANLKELTFVCFETADLFSILVLQVLRIISFDFLQKVAGCSYWKAVWAKYSKECMHWLKLSTAQCHWARSHTGQSFPSLPIGTGGLQWFVPWDANSQTDLAATVFNFHSYQIISLYLHHNLSLMACYCSLFQRVCHSLGPRSINKMMYDWVIKGWEKCINLCVLLC